MTSLLVADLIGVAVFAASGASAAVVASLAIFRLHPHLYRLRRTVLVLDAAGLGLSTVSGTVEALDACGGGRR